MLKYINAYSAQLKEQVHSLIEEQKLGDYLLRRYPSIHPYNSEKALYNYTMELKNSHLKSSAPLSKITYDNKIHTINSALGTHTYISRVQGGKLKAKNEIRIATLFKKAPEQFLKMIVTHELAHLKIKEHDKAFYKLCTYIEPNYHQFEFDTRLYLIHLETFGELF